MVPKLQPVAFQRMSDAIERVRQRLLRAAACLESTGISYAVVGGNAVAAWISRVDEAAVRNTRDVDILLRRSDLAAATVALEQAGFIHRRVASLGQAGPMDIFLDGPDAKARDVVHIVFAREKTRENSVAENPDPDESESTGGFRLISRDALPDEAHRLAGQGQDAPPGLARRGTHRAFGRAAASPGASGADPADH